MKAKRLSRFWAGITAIAMAIGFCGCSNSNPSEGKDLGTGAEATPKVTIAYWVQDNPAFAKAAQILAESFTKENPHIVVDVQSFSGYDTKFPAAIASGTAGDVVENYGSALQYAKGGTILPIPDSIISKSHIEASYYESALSNRLYEGRYYGLPEEVNVESPALLINNTILKNANIQIPAAWEAGDGPETWAELIEFAKLLTVKNSDGSLRQSGLGIYGDEMVSLFLSYIWQAGGDYRDEANNAVHFTTPEARASAEFILEQLYSEDRVNSADFAKRTEGFKAGTVAMAIGAPWIIPSIKADMPDFDCTYYNLPPFVEGAKPYFLSEGGWGHVVPASSKHPTEAWALVEYLHRPENLLIWAKETGAIPSLMSLADDDYYTNGDGKAEAGRTMKMLEYGKDPGSYTMDTLTLVWDIGFRNVLSMATKQITVDQFLENMDKEINKMIAENK